MENEKQFKDLFEAEEFILGVKKAQAKGMAHIALTLAIIRRDRLFLAVSNTWKGYIKLNRQELGYSQSRRLADIGEKYLTFQKQLAENGISISENMSKMELFDSEIAAKDPLFFKKFKDLSYRALKDYIRKYKEGIQTYISESSHGGNVTVKGTSLYIGGEKVRGLNLNEISKAIHEGKRVVVAFAEDDNEARRVKRRLAQ